MPQTNQEVTVTIIAVVALLSVISIIVLLLAIYYTNTKKGLLKEKALMKLTFDAEITKTQLEVQEQTMQTIGADLHDNIGQLLSLTSLTLNSIELDSDLKAKQKIDAAIDLTLRSIKEMRLLGKLLQGDQLIGMGLSEAIRYEINWIEKSGQYKVNYINDKELPAANNPDKDLILFRILQEILNNIMKHSQATEIGIRLEYCESLLHLGVTDNGIGFNPESLPSEQTGMGLQNIQKRAGIIGGTATIVSDPGKGAAITIVTPYP